MLLDGLVHLPHGLGQGANQYGRPLTDEISLLKTWRDIGDPDVQKSYYFTGTGFIAQNVYLFAAAHGLAAWFHNCERDRCTEEFKLTPQQRILFAQSVGYPEF